MNPTAHPAAVTAPTAAAGPISVSWYEGRRLRTVATDSSAAAVAAMRAAVDAGHRPDGYAVSDLADRPALQAVIRAEFPTA
ncbi:hypothetical protein [Micromonospora sp. WMMD980]|uniref:hypothetical protein n=1 Tax=Micromonospora sp. WMMD980 TaxID=3016088 RepID=UPI002417632E|nr:hypothetical protein [Micromonospora sp. WMMD980]MDG4802282.1 hypothetical protein [Micromonospora sp. WMMD980]